MQAALSARGKLEGTYSFKKTFCTSIICPDCMRHSGHSDKQARYSPCSHRTFSLGAGGTYPHFFKEDKEFFIKIEHRHCNLKSPRICRKNTHVYHYPNQDRELYQHPRSSLPVSIHPQQSPEQLTTLLLSCL